MCNADLTLVRHTKPDIAEGVCYGVLDLDVADSFEAESSAVLSGLTKPDLLISSPLRRCQRLAHKISLAFDLPIVTDERVREMDFGDWEGIAWNDIERSQIDQWTNDFYRARPHGGESVEMLAERVQSALGSYRKTGRSHLIVCHAGVIKAAFATGIMASDFSTSVAFGGIVKLPDFSDD